MQTINLIKKEHYAILQIQRGKVNAINQLLVDEFRATVQEVQNSKTIRGLILTGTPHFFSAGLDVIELYDYNKSDIRNFFISFGKLHIELAKFTKPLVCAINGHAPAGGTVIAIAADYRIMADGEQYTIGLNEMAVNIPLSQMLIYAYSFWLGQSKANDFLLDGKLLNPKEALKYGLVNEVVNAKDLMPKAEQKMQQYLMADPKVFNNIKSKLRKDWLNSINEDDSSELEESIRIWWHPDIRSKLKAFVDKLNNK